MALSETTGRVQKMRPARETVDVSYVYLVTSMETACHSPSASAAAAVPAAAAWLVPRPLLLLPSTAILEPTRPSTQASLAEREEYPHSNAR